MDETFQICYLYSMKRLKFCVSQAVAEIVKKFIQFLSSIIKDAHNKMVLFFCVTVYIRPTAFFLFLCCYRGLRAVADAATIGIESCLCCLSYIHRATNDNNNNSAGNDDNPTSSNYFCRSVKLMPTHTHARLTALCPGQPG